MRIPLVLAIALFVFSVAVDAAIALGLRSGRREKRGWKVYLASAVACWVWLACIIAVPKRSEDADILPLMWMLWSYLGLYVAKLVYLLTVLSGRLVRLLSRRRFRLELFRWSGLGLGVAVLAVMWCGVWFTRRHIEVTEVTVCSPRVPQAFDGFRIVQLSDLHVGTWGRDTSFISSLVDTVNALRPDLIVFTGDLVNRKTDELQPFLYDLARLDAPCGVMAVLGNHDYGDYVDWASPEERLANNELLHRQERGMGWDLLLDERRPLARGGDTIVVAGVQNWGDAPFPTYGSLEKALPDSRDSAVNRHDSHFKILLTHNPEHWNREVSEGSNIDLTLSGHTHAMQVMVGSMTGRRWSPAVWRYPLWGGLYERTGGDGEPVSLYVNIGAGEVGMPARLLGAYPEVTLFVLRRQDPE